MFHSTQELAGQMQLSVRAFDGKDLDEVAVGDKRSIRKIRKGRHLRRKTSNRIKAGQETQFYNSLSSVLGKSAQLATCNYHD